MTDPIKNFSPLRYPTGSVEQYFGEGDGLYSLTKAHSGWDIIGEYGTAIYSVRDGIVCEINYDNPNDSKNYGNCVRILSDNKLVHLYGHLSQINVTLGQEVKTGDKIGEMGNTGYVVSQGYTRQYWHHIEGIDFSAHPGTHLHIGFVPVEETVLPHNNVDIFKYWNGKNYQQLYEFNSYKGAVDPVLYMPFNHSFQNELRYGMQSDEVLYMQLILKKLGFIPAVQDVLGYYGKVTRRAVYDFQCSFKVADQKELDRLGGGLVGPKTRTALSIIQTG